MLKFRCMKILQRGGKSDETDLSAKEKTENERAWLQKKNGNKERKKRS